MCKKLRRLSGGYNQSLRNVFRTILDIPCRTYVQTHTETFNKELVIRIKHFGSSRPTSGFQMARWLSGRDAELLKGKEIKNHLRYSKKFYLSKTFDRKRPHPGETTQAFFTTSFAYPYIWICIYLLSQFKWRCCSPCCFLGSLSQLSGNCSHAVGPQGWAVSVFTKKDVSQALNIELSNG